MLKIFELLGNGASQVLQLYLPFPCFPKYYLECGPPIGTWTLVSLFKMKKNHLIKMQENQLRSQRCFIFLCNVGRMERIYKILEAGTGSWSYVINIQVCPNFFKSEISMLMYVRLKWLPWNAFPFSIFVYFFMCLRYLD